MATNHVADDPPYCRGWPPRSRRIRISTAACVVLFSTLGVQSAVADPPIEFGVKAAFISKFAPYVEWPPASFSSPNSPLLICVVGSDLVTSALDQLVANLRAGTRPIVVQHVPQVARDLGCHIAYLAQSSEQAVASDLAALQGAPILTVTDADRTPGAIGIISFTIRDNRVRFNVDDAAAASAGLVISSKLLNLAYSVKLRH